MAFKKGENPNHPKRGSSIKSSPIRSRKAIENIKVMLVKKEDFRNYCLFTFGINTAWRANELLSLQVRDVWDLKVDDVLDHKQRKNSKYRGTLVNEEAHQAIHLWLNRYNPQSGDLPLFPAKVPGRWKGLDRKYRNVAIGVPCLCNMVKAWGREVGLEGRIGSHTLRKTWGYQQRTQFNVPPYKIQEAYGHATERQTLEYLGILSDEIMDIYRNVV